MTIYGYARVSTDGQTLAAQEAALTAAGCAKVNAEKVPGVLTDRKALAKAISVLQEGRHADCDAARLAGSVDAGLAHALRAVPRRALGSSRWPIHGPILRRRMAD